jgi:hypothetical protein
VGVTRSDGFFQSDVKVGHVMIRVLIQYHGRLGFSHMKRGIHILFVSNRLILAT